MPLNTTNFIQNLKNRDFEKQKSPPRPMEKGAGTLAFDRKYDTPASPQGDGSGG